MREGGGREGGKSSDKRAMLYVCIWANEVICGILLLCERRESLGMRLTLTHSLDALLFLLRTFTNMPTNICRVKGRKEGWERESEEGGPEG